MSEETKPQDSDQVMAAGQGIMVVMGVFQQVASAIGGYRTTLEQGGVGKDAADQMAAQLHAWILAQMAAGANKGTGGDIKGALEQAIAQRMRQGGSGA